MTREEASAIYRKHFPESCKPVAAIDMMVELGILKLDPPKDTIMDKLENELRKRYFHDKEMIGLKQALTELGLEVAVKTKR